MTIEISRGLKIAGKSGEKSAPIRPIDVAKKVVDSRASRKVAVLAMVGRYFDASC